MEPINRILFLSGIVDERNTTDLMANIIDINNYDDAVMNNAMQDLNVKVQGLTVRKMTDGYPTCVALDDGTQLGIGLSDSFYADARPPITLHIKSGGGYVEHGMALINMIRTSKTPIHAVVHFGHSMAFAIACACDYRTGFPTSRLMIHDMSGGVSGTTEQLIRATENSKILRALADQVIIDNSKLTQEMLDKINSSVEDRYFTGQELLDFGLLDEVEEYSIPEHKQTELRNKATQKLIEEDKLDEVGSIADRLSKIRTRAMVIEEIYDLIDDNNMAEIARLLECDENGNTVDVDGISFDELEAILDYIRDFSREEPYETF